MGLVAAQPQFAYQTLEEAFPIVDLPVQPLGNRVTVQIRTPKKKTKSGLILTDDTRETQLWNEQTGKVVAIGPLAFKNQTTLEDWPEGRWFEVGDFVRVPLYGADKLAVPVPGHDDEFALFVTFKEKEIIGKIVGDPLAIRAFV